MRIERRLKLIKCLFLLKEEIDLHIKNKIKTEILRA